MVAKRLFYRILILTYPLRWSARQSRTPPTHEVVGRLALLSLALDIFDQTQQNSTGTRIGLEFALT
jgi:hypothetical protein